MPRVAYLTNVPAPYRERMHEIISEQKLFLYTVIYCTQLEPNRKWKLKLGDYEKKILKETSNTFFHNNLNVWKLLNKLNPNVLIITGFKPTMLYGVAWCLMNRKKIVVYNDGTFESERRFSFIQKLIRKITFSFTSAFVAPGKGTFDLYRSYGITDDKMFRSCLCIDNSRFVHTDIKTREFHIMFSGQITDRKMPMFFVEVAKGLKNTISNLKVLIVGDGDKRSEMLHELEKSNIDFTFTGFLDQETLPAYYSKTKLFLFPTLNDPWGIVVNEACASGTPVLTCQNAGAADDLVIHGLNGYILPLEVDIWVTNATLLLDNQMLLKSFSSSAIDVVKSFNHNQAANGIAEAVTFSLKKNKL